jgi:hypothetical protein
MNRHGIYIYLFLNGNTYYGTPTKRPKIKRPNPQNIQAPKRPKYKTSQASKFPGLKTSKLQNIPTLIYVEPMVFSEKISIMFTNCPHIQNWRIFWQTRQEWSILPSICSSTVAKAKRNFIYLARRTAAGRLPPSTYYVYHLMYECVVCMSTVWKKYTWYGIYYISYKKPNKQVDCY